MCVCVCETDRQTERDRQRDLMSAPLGSHCRGERCTRPSPQRPGISGPPRPGEVQTRAAVQALWRRPSGDPPPCPAPSAVSTLSKPTPPSSQECTAYAFMWEFIFQQIGLGSVPLRESWEGKLTFLIFFFFLKLQAMWIERVCLPLD